MFPAVCWSTLLLPCHTLTRPKPGIPSTEMSGWCLESAGHEFLGWVLWCKCKLVCQAGHHVYIPEYILQCMCEPNSNLQIWDSAIVAGWGLPLKSSIWGSHCVCSCKWYIIWYLNWNRFLLIAEKHTGWNSGINDVTGNFAISLWMAFCIFSSLGRSVSMFVTFCSVIFKVWKKNQKGNDKNPNFF